jgi:hypothetical protein
MFAAMATWSLDAEGKVADDEEEVGGLTSS